MYTHDDPFMRNAFINLPFFIHILFFSSFGLDGAREVHDGVFDCDGVNERMFLLFWRVDFTCGLVPTIYATWSVYVGAGSLIGRDLFDERWLKDKSEW
ncbi:hypothetical protein J3F83DRAFT_162730 [Trichoderma novae-zelandiae]